MADHVAITSPLLIATRYTSRELNWTTMCCRCRKSARTRDTAGRQGCQCPVHPDLVSELHTFSLLWLLFSAQLSTTHGLILRLQARLGLQAPEAFHGLGPVAWHPHKDQLAAADAMDRVHICSTSCLGASTSGRAGAAQELPSRMALHHELQQQAGARLCRSRDINNLLADMATQHEE